MPSSAGFLTPAQEGKEPDWSGARQLTQLLEFSGSLQQPLPSVLESLIALVNSPEPEHPLTGELAEEYTKDRKKFFKNAEEFTKKNAEKRPSE